MAVDWLRDYYDQHGKSGSYSKCGSDWRAKAKADWAWYSDVPAHVINEAFRAADVAYKGMVRNRSHGSVADLPRCRRKLQRSFGVACLSKGRLYPQKIGTIKSNETVPETVSTGKVVFEGGRWYFAYSYEVEQILTESQGRVCAIDPGVRTFATVFSPEQVHKIGSGQFGRIVRLSLWLDDLISRAAKEKRVKRKLNMQLAANRMRVKIKNLVQDLHYQTISWLLNNYDVIVFPEANFTSAVGKTGRKIRAKSVRALLSWSFAKFRDRLKHKADLFGKTVVIVDESYTSKTHNVTGEINHKLGGSKTITSRGLRIDRDVNGALGILLKALLVQTCPSRTATKRLVTAGMEN